MLTDEDKKQASQAFDDVDEKRSGVIPNTLESLIMAVRLAGLNPTESETAKHQQESVAEYGDTVSKEQFLELLSKFEWKPRDELQDILKADFQMFAADDTGVLDPDDLIHILTKEGREVIPTDQVTCVINKLEKDDNGKITIEDLIDKMLFSAPL